MHTERLGAPAGTSAQSKLRRLSDQPQLGIMERHRLKLWMNHAYGEMEKAGP